MNYRLCPGGALNGVVLIPGDKSISHRALILASLAEGTSYLQGFLEGEDNLATLNALRELGIIITQPKSEEVIIVGKGLYGLKKPSCPLYLGNSGTAARLLMGILAGQSFDSVIEGDPSLSKRPMERVAEPLRQMGASLETTASCLPVRINGGNPLEGIFYELPIVSAQVKSALLLAGLTAKGMTILKEKGVSRDHTERMLSTFSYPFSQRNDHIELIGRQSLKPVRMRIPGDFSSAFFFIVGATIAPGSCITLEGVGVNPTRIGALHILREMGADITFINQRNYGTEPVADIVVKNAPLKGIAIPESFLSSAIDEIPALMIAAATANGVTILTGAAELRVKESDRIKATVLGLTALGILATETADGMRIEGGCLKGGIVDSHEDHRIVMAFSVAALRSQGEVIVKGCNNVNTSFPQFPELGKKLGLRIEGESV